MIKSYFRVLALSVDNIANEDSKSSIIVDLLNVLISFSWLKFISALTIVREHVNKMKKETETFVYITWRHFALI